MVLDGDFLHNEIKYFNHAPGHHNPYGDTSSCAASSQIVDTLFATEESFKVSIYECITRKKKQKDKTYYIRAHI